MKAVDGAADWPTGRRGHVYGTLNCFLFEAPITSMPQYSGRAILISGCSSTFIVSHGLVPATIRKNVFETKPGTTSALSKSIRRQVEECGRASNAFKYIASMTNSFAKNPKP